MRKIFKIGIAVGFGAAIILGLGLGFGLRGGEEDVKVLDSLIIETENGVIQGQGPSDASDVLEIKLKLGWFTAYLANVFLNKLQGPILPRKSRDHINPNHAS